MASSSSRASRSSSLFSSNRRPLSPASSTSPSHFSNNNRLIPRSSSNTSASSSFPISGNGIGSRSMTPSRWLLLCEILDSIRICYRFCLSRDIDEANVEEAVEKLKSQRINAYGIVCHVSDTQHRKNLVENTVQKYGKIDIVVCNAAANPSTDPILSSKETVIDKLWEINVKSSILLLQLSS